MCHEAMHLSSCAAVWGRCDPVFVFQRIYLFDIDDDEEEMGGGKRGIMSTISQRTEHDYSGDNLRSLLSVQRG